jgi:hypothetical protein
MIRDIFHKRYKEIYFHFPNYLGGAETVPEEIEAFFTQSAQIILYDLIPQIKRSEETFQKVFNAFIRELGVINIGQGNTYQEKCLNYLLNTYNVWMTKDDVSDFIKKKISMIEIIFSMTNEEIQVNNNKDSEEIFNQSVNELNQRFQDAKLGFYYQNKSINILNDKLSSSKVPIVQSTSTTNSIKSINTFENIWKNYKQPKDYRDIFICHASEDKANIIKPLLLKCIEKKITFWFDNAEIKWGDSLSAKINEGLKISKYVFVILSNNFMQKNYPKKELETALNLEFSSGITKVLPLLIGNKNEINNIFSEYPILNNKLYFSWDLGIEKIIEKLIERLNP